MKKILITGITGFVGSHLADFLLVKKNIKVFGLRRYHLSKEDNILHIINKIEWFDCDLLDPKAIQNVLKKIKEQKKIKNVLFIDTIDWQEIVNINQIIDANLIHLQNLKLFKTVLPSKMFESMALKKPILAGLIGESIEIITKSNFGLKIIPENPNSLVENILHLRSNPEMSKIMGNNGFNLVKKKYNRKVLAYQMIQTIDTI